MNKLIYPIHESLYFQNSLAQIVEYSGHYVRVEWLAAPMLSQNLREVYEQILLLLKESQLSKVLSDHQLMPAIMPQDQLWLATDWAPRAVHESLYRHCAVVDAYDVYNRLSTTSVVQHIRRSLDLRVAHFPDHESAERWLLSRD